ncbi:unannotated protein [freshwater metagenome]|uniref:Unannotated protein n=1 Tax=freshwater metagenome TaxID=449393 RepID=A0A6J7JJB4_9ZZZZ
MSANSSTNTWQTPAPVSIVGTVDSSTTMRISAALPRGITKSTLPRALSSALTVARSSDGTS